MILDLVLLSAAAGAAAFSGAALAFADEDRGGWLSDTTRYFIIALGGGALIGAVGLVLVPHGLESQPLWSGALSFVGGGLVFMLVDKALQRRGTPVSQLVALNLDFVPESLVLGAAISGDYEMAVFLAVVISAQNLPEGFGAYREIRSAHNQFLRKHVLQIMALCPLVGVAAALLGYGAFSLESTALGALMTFCAGGILYLVFNDVAPDVHEEGHWTPALGAVLGFTVALVGYGLTG